jgi:hypothetical protein
VFSVVWLKEYLPVILVKKNSFDNINTILRNIDSATSRLWYFFTYEIVWREEIYRNPKVVEGEHMR